jgi:adenine specific DNA methylase Mod
MQFQVTYIDFDFSSDDDTWGDVDPDYQQEVTEETIGQIWEAVDEDDLIEEITCATGWCIRSIDYRTVLK